MPAKAAPKKSKSAIKRARQTVALSLRNRSIKNMIKTLVKRVETEARNKSREGADLALKQAVSAIDKAGKKGIMHRNTASRKISRLTKLVNSMLLSEAA